MPELWLVSAIINAICAFVLIAFAIRLTQGAGFACKVALTRLAHRLALCLMCCAMLRVALAQAAARSVAVEQWFWFELSFFLVLAISIYRHLDAPTIPTNARWGRKISTAFHVH